MRLRYLYDVFVGKGGGFRTTSMVFFVGAGKGGEGEGDRKAVRRYAVWMSLGL